MVDLTLITCLAPCLSGGGTSRDVVDLLVPLLGSGVPLVVYVDREFKEELEGRLAGQPVRLEDSSPERRRSSIGSIAELERLRAASTLPGIPPLDTFVVTLTKMGMLHDQSIWDPFGTRHLAWIDADIARSVHPRYLAGLRLLDALPCLLPRFLLMARSTPTADAAGRAAASRVQGQFFGGATDAIPEVNALYYRLLDDLLRQGELPTEESILTGLLDRHPERFDRFVLQENGLLGAFFEEMRTGRVPIERTLIY